MACPFYISGDWCAAMMSPDNHLDPVQTHPIDGELKYFNLEIARAALALPNEVLSLMPKA